MLFRSVYPAEWRNKMKVFNSLKELKPYYNKQTNTYDFTENGEPFGVDFTFSLVIKANINARDINAWDINARNINAGDIKAFDNKALD